MRRIISNYFVAFILLVSGATAKTVLDTDLTSDFTSTNDDQYPWSSALPPRGPYYHQDNTKRTIDIINSDNIPINQYDKSILNNEKTWSLSQNKYNQHFIKSHDIYDVIKNKNFMDNSNKQTNTDKLNLLDNIEHEKIKVEKSIILQNKIQHQEYKKNFKVDEKKYIKKKYTDSILMKSDLVKNKIDILNLKIDNVNNSNNANNDNDTKNREERSTNDDDKYIESKDPLESRVTPISLDFNSDNSNDYDYIDEMDELLKIKKLEEKENANRQNKRGDMDPESSLYPSIVIDGVVFVPTRGDVVANQPVQTIDKNKRTKRMTNTDNDDDNIWGFDEDDGMPSDDYDRSINHENNIRQNEENKRAREWQRKRYNDEIERRKLIKQMSKKDENRVKTEIDTIKIEYERRLEKQRREQEEKLRSYIERNRPIVVNNYRVNKQDELSRQNTRQSSRLNPQKSTRYNQDDRMQRSRDELSQRNTMNLRKSSSNNSNSNKPDYYSRNPSSTRQSQSQRDNENLGRRREIERESLRQRHYQDQRRRHNIFEQKRPNTGVINITKIEHNNHQSKDEIARLESLPVAAKIIIDPNLSTGILSRGYFDDSDNLPSIDPNRPGLEISNFPASKTRKTLKPPKKIPDPCSWAIVHCCPIADNNRRLINCFENFNCPGVNWDPSPCRQSISNAARDDIVRYYAMKK